MARATVEPVALLKDDKGISWRTLFDTGASIDCGFRENLLRLGAQIHRGKPVTLIMADKSKRRVDEWADLRLSLGDHEVVASFVVIPEENRDIDLILGLPTQTSLGSITYGQEGLRVTGGVTADDGICSVRAMQAHSVVQRIREECKSLKVFLGSHNADRKGTSSACARNL